MIPESGSAPLREVVGEPGQPHRRGRQADHREPQRLPVERPAQHQHAPVRRTVRAGHAVARALGDGADAELLGHVRGDPGVGGRGGGEHRDAGGRVSSSVRIRR